MKRSDLTKYQQVRLSKANICPICKSPIFNDDDIVFDARPFSRSKIYTFYHESCVGGIRNGKEKVKKAEETRKFSETAEYAIYRKIFEEILAETKAPKAVC